LKIKSKKISLSLPAKVLIVQTAFIGDVVLATPLIRVVKKYIPEAEIHFITIPSSQNVVETLPYLDKLWIYDKRDKDSGLINLVKYALKLRKENFQLALVPHRSLRSAFLVFMAKIPRRIGFNRSTGSFLFTDRVIYPGHLHEVERNLTLLHPLSISVSEKIPPDIYPDDNDRRVVETWLGVVGMNEKKSFITIAPGSIWFTKRWPTKYWSQLTELLHEKNYPCAIIGSVDDKALAAEIVSTSKAKIFNSCGLFSLRQSAELIRRSRLLISNDSAPTHLGSAVKKPVLTIFGSTIPAFGFSPYSTGSRVAEVKNLECRPCTDHGKKKCPKKHFKCMWDLTPDIIFEMVWKMINESHTDKSEKN